MNEEQLNNQENYRTEYKEVATNHRFYASLRFIVAAFTTTIQSALFTLYNQAQQQVPPRGHAIITPLVGLLTMFAIFIIERRNISLFRAMMQRGRELEFSLGLTDGQFSRLSQPELVRPTGWKRFLTHTWGINLVYGIIFTLWSVLLVFHVKNLFEERSYLCQSTTSKRVESRSLKMINRSWIHSQISL